MVTRPSRLMVRFAANMCRQGWLTRLMAIMLHSIKALILVVSQSDDALIFSLRAIMPGNPNQKSKLSLTLVSWQICAIFSSCRRGFSLA